MADVAPVDQDDPSTPPRPDQVVPVEKIVPNPDQPRRNFTEGQLQELADSIRTHGVLQPIIVRSKLLTKVCLSGPQKSWRRHRHKRQTQKNQKPVSSLTKTPIPKRSKVICPQLSA
jgi:hypothetical protein